ncbi:MAG: 30S ribosomal protein S4e [Euryarchaeota archaeon]|nr:30S ribosomal protein S4e [Euryarchaeota archaeon]
MPGKHMKRIAAPRALILPRKEKKWVYKVSAGPHPVERSIPLAVVVRDHLHLCETGREARRIIGAGDVTVDGAAQKDHKFPVGLMDVVSVPKTKQTFRILLDHHARLIPVEVKGDEARWKLARVENKTTVTGGKTQINLHDGRNILVPKDQYKTGDVLKLEVPTQKVLGTHKLGAGSLGLITGGAHAGEVAPIKAVEVKKGPYPNMVVLTNKEGTEFRTIKDYVFPVGEKTAEVKIPEAKTDGQ